jgi:hypothetical protein
MPPLPLEWLPSEHLVFVLLDLPNERDVSAIMAPALARNPREEKGFDPGMVAKPSAQRLTLLSLVAYCYGIASSRKTTSRPSVA